LTNNQSEITLLPSIRGTVHPPFLLLAAQGRKYCGGIKKNSAQAAFNVHFREPVRCMDCAFDRRGIVLQNM